MGRKKQSKEVLEDNTEVLEDNTEVLEDNTEVLEDEFLPEDDAEETETAESKGYEVVTPVKFKGKILKTGDSIDGFDGIDDLVAENIVKKV